MKELFKKIKNIFVKPVKEEVKEILDLHPTEQDFAQGKKLATIAAAVMMANGIPMSVNSTELMGKALAYLVRDVKDGIDDHDKLLVSRIVQEIKKNK